MAEARVRWHERVTRLALTTFLATSLLALARVNRLPFWWAVPLLCVPALFVQRGQLPTRLTRLYERLVALTLALLVLAGFVHTAYPIFPETTTRAALTAVAFALALLTLPATLLQTALSHARVLLPAGTGLLLGAALSVSGEVRRYVIPELLPVPFVALVSYLLLAHPPLTSQHTQGLAARRAVRLVLSLGLALALAVGATRFLPWAQPFVEQVFASVFGDRAGRGTSGFGKESRLGDIESLALDHTLALRLWTDAPRHLRLRVATRFDGRAWSTDVAQGRRRPLPAPTVLPGAAALTRLADVPGTTFMLEESASRHATVWGRVLPALPFETEALATPLGTALVRVSDARLESDGLGVAFAASTAELGLFGYLATPTPPDAPQTPEQVAAALTLPPVVDPRLRALAADLAGRSASATGRAAATIEHVQRQCRYALDVGRFTSNDPVAEFLFVKRRGYCEYFASAATLLLRLEGVPTRYVTGFSARGASRVGDHYLVRLSDAHAWIEYFDGRAWVEADPTPPADYDLLHARDEGWWSAAWESARSTFALVAAALRQGLRTGSWLAALRLALGGVYGALGRHWAPLLSVLAGLLAWWRLPWRRWLAAWRRRATGTGQATGTTPALRALWANVERLLALEGLVRPASVPPLEFVRSLPPARLAPELRELAEETALALYAGLFAGRPPSDVAHSRLRERVDIARRRHNNRKHWEVT